MWLRQPDNWSCWIIYSAEELHNPHYANMKNRLLSQGALSLFNTCEKTWKLCLFYKLKSEREQFFFFGITLIHKTESFLAVGFDFSRQMWTLEHKHTVFWWWHQLSSEWMIMSCVVGNGMMGNRKWR